MFENPIDYNEVNAFTILTTTGVFQDYLKYIKFGENDLILDVGSGSGNVTSEVLIPAIKRPNFRLIGGDISKISVGFANKRFGNSKVSFRVVDIVEKDEQVLRAAFTEKELNPGFDLVFSFSALHWTFDEEQCFRNIFTLMKPGGQTLLWFVGYCIYCEIWNYIRNKEEWQSYIKEPAAKFTFHGSTDVADKIRDMLKRIGFEDIICDCDSKNIVHDINYNWRQLMQCIDPHIHNVPEHLHSQYMDDVMGEFTRLYEKTTVCLTIE